MLCVLWAHDTSSPPAGCGPISPSADAFAAVNAKCEKPIYLWDKRHDDVGSKRNGEDYTTLSSYYNTSALFAVWLGVYAFWSVYRSSWYCCCRDNFSFAAADALPAFGCNSGAWMCVCDGCANAVYISFLSLSLSVAGRNWKIHFYVLHIHWIWLCGHLKNGKLFHTEHMSQWWRKHLDR